MKNNKIKVSKFFQMGGVVEFWLQKRLHFMGVPDCIYATSSESFAKAINQLDDITQKIMGQFGRAMDPPDIVKIRVRLDNELYAVDCTSWYQLCLKFIHEEGYVYSIPDKVDVHFKEHRL